MPYELRGNRDCGWQKLGTELFTFTSINKVSQFFFFLSVAAEKHYSKQQQNKSIDRFADRDKKKDEGRANRQRGAGAEKLHLKAPSITRLCMYCYN